MRLIMLSNPIKPEGHERIYYQDRDDLLKKSPRMISFYLDLHLLLFIVVNLK